MQHLKDAMLIASTYNLFKQGSALVAGGAIRDHITKRQPKDVDVLVEWESKADYREIEILADRLGYNCMFHGVDYGEQTLQEVRAVFTLSKAGKLPIDVIFLNCTVEERVNNFSCNICKVFLQGNQIVATDEAMHDITHNKLTFREDTPDEYKDRLLGYFPEHEEAQCLQIKK